MSTAVVFIHGLAKKPSPDQLKEIWLWGLNRDNPRPDVFAPPNQGINLGNRGVRSFLNYYADVFYGTDYDAELDSYYESTSELEALAAEQLDRIDGEIKQPDLVTERERAFLKGFEKSLGTNSGLALSRDLQTSTDINRDLLEIASWLPDVAKQAIIKKAAMEAYYYLFDKKYERKDGCSFMVRQELRERCLDELRKAQAVAEKIVIISHSMGTIVAYDVLRNCSECPSVDTLITLGSPLGIQEVQDQLAYIGNRNVDFPSAKLNRWINIYDPLDPVAGADPILANDYQRVDGKNVEDIKESNWGYWRHTVTHYLAGLELRRSVSDSLD